MSARIFGLNNFSLVPGPDLFLSRDNEGKTTARRSFTCLKNALANPIIQSKLAKGTAITALCSDIPADFQALTIDAFDSQDAPGGMTAVNVTFTGYIEEGEYGFDREINYSARGTTYRRPLTEHPKFIEHMETQHHQVGEGFIALILGEAYARGETFADYQIVRNSSDEEIIKMEGYENEITTGWWDLIVKKGIRDYDAATIEWTRSTANAGGLSGSDIAKLAKSDDPPGNPPEPDYEGWWQLVDLSDDRGSGSSSNSLTWRFVAGVKIPFLHD